MAPTVTLQFEDIEACKEFVKWWMGIVKAKDEEAAKDKAVLFAKAKADASP